MVANHPNYYFAYGSNLYQSRLLARVPSARFIALGHLQGYQLQFHKVGLDQSGKANIQATSQPDDIVWGAVFQMDLSELPSLDQAESLGVGYERQCLSILTAEGCLEAFTYLALLIDDTLRPFHWYKAYIVQGALDLSLPAAYIQDIQAVPSIPDPDAERRQHHRALLG
ncbi:gamma-glutamylcyclotransferase family protein [Acaryochloris sp. CCMEE 5410]|uniref:gamma-glutamylcyclotransferase family protein n=1 Tax=Acaryochloris sp. CCMEE 5410 TaxID=310037 RepID=UPI0002484A88|nr:gamma-glutamylcyclotransferase family protein [Acaryochloris sp. CCMEE 5410]KAI9133167.1 gamma-glutamylcyclotransferase [Acaryochloris sp. CCMEE 5410]